MGRESKIRKLRRLKIIPEVKQRGSKKPMAKGWRITIWSIVAVAFVLVVMGIWAYSGRDHAAKVGSQVITANEVEVRAFEALSAKLTPDQLNPNDPNFQQQLEGEKEATLQRLIQEKIYIEAAKNEGLEITSDDYLVIAQEKMENEVKLQVVQKLEKDWTDEDKEAWKDWMTEAGYESEESLVSFIQTRFKGEIEFKAHRQKAVGDTLDAMEATDNEAKAWYDEKGAMKISHILLSYDAINHEASKGKEQKEKLNDIHKSILDGEITFADAANKHTEDQKGNGGDLGWYNIQDGKLINEAGTAGLVPEFERMALTLAPGDVSGIVQTQFGFHIIKCTKTRNNSTNYDLKEGVRLAIIKLSVGDTSNPQAPPAPEEEWTSIKTQASDIVSQIKSGSIDFATAATRFSVDQLTKTNGGELPPMMASDVSGYFWASMEDAKQYEGQGMYPFEVTVVEKAHNMSNDQVSEPIRTSSGWVIVKKIDYRNAKSLSFDDVKEQVKRDVLVLKKNEFESNWLEGKRGEITVSIGNPWIKFANWWENSVVAPMGDFGTWVSELLGKNASDKPTNQIPIDGNSDELPNMEDPAVQEQIQRMLQEQADKQGITPGEGTPQPINP